MLMIETERLILRTLTLDDAAFYLELVNEPSWLKYIGDKGVRTLNQARESIQNGPIEMQDRFGFSLYLAELKDGGDAIGMCGLIKRESLQDVDIGFAFLSRYCSEGYGYESASAVMAFAKNVVGLTRVVGITNPDNHSSIKLLEKIGLKFERMVQLASDDIEIMLFSLDF